MLELASTDVSRVEVEDWLFELGGAGFDPGFLLTRWNEDGKTVIYAPEGGHICLHGETYGGIGDVPGEACTSACRGFFAPCRRGAHQVQFGTGLVLDDGGGFLYRVWVRDLEPGSGEVTLEYAGIR